MAEVYVARHPSHSTPVVVKRLLPQLAHVLHLRQRLVVEAEIGTAIKHPNAVKIFELGHVNDEVFIAMEYVAGCNLRILLREGTKRGYRIPPWFSLYTITKVLDVLVNTQNVCCTNGEPKPIVHADITPSNIFISRRGDIKLGDFGVARHGKPPPQQPSMLTGKLAYLAPELYAGDCPDAQTDIFSTGVVLWEMLTQRRLFGGQREDAIVRSITHSARPRPSLIMRDVPQELDKVVLSAVAINKAERIPSAEIFYNQVRSVLPKLGHHPINNNLPLVINSILGPDSPPKTNLPPLRWVSCSRRVSNNAALSKISPKTRSSTTHSETIPLAPPVPTFWLRSPNSVAVGGYSVHQLLDWAFKLSTLNPRSSKEISADGKHWVDLKQFLHLTSTYSSRASTSDELLNSIAWQTTTKNQSWLSVLATVTRTRASGALLVAPFSDPPKSPWVLYTHHGQLLELRPPAWLPFLPQSLIRSPKLTATMLSYAIHHLLIARVPLINALSAVSPLGETAAKTLVAEQHLAQITATPYLSFSFSTKSLKPSTKPSSLLANFHQIARQTLSIQQMQDYIINQNNGDWKPCIDYEAMLHSFSFPRKMNSIAKFLEHQTPPSSFFCEGPPNQVQDRCVVAYLLLQAELLKPTLLIKDSRAHNA